ncbi:MAG: P1 family peptidase, partial [Anaerolineaceae bacterium]|nr:P1 family peptidase [Anaerolineaceae bacterium]
GRILAGARKINLKASQSTSLSMADTLTSMVKPLGKLALRIAAKSNTVIGVVATNAKLTKAEATRVAMMAQDGLARVIRPAHTMLDGDTVFSLSTGHLRTDLSTVGAYAAMVAEKSILNAIMETTSAYGLPAFRQ